MPDSFKVKPELEEFRRRAVQLIAAAPGGKMTNSELAKALNETTSRTQGAMKAAITAQQVVATRKDGRMVYSLPDEF